MASAGVVSTASMIQFAASVPLRWCVLPPETFHSVTKRPLRSGSASASDEPACTVRVGRRRAIVASKKAEDLYAAKEWASCDSVFLLIPLTATSTHPLGSSRCNSKAAETDNSIVPAFNETPTGRSTGRRQEEFNVNGCHALTVSCRCLLFGAFGKSIASNF